MSPTPYKTAQKTGLETKEGGNRQGWDELKLEDAMGMVVRGGRLVKYAIQGLAQGYEVA